MNWTRRAMVTVLAALPLPAADPGYLVYFGTYTATASKGIYAYRFQPSTGELTSLGIAAEAPNPSFLAIHPNHRFLYAVNWKASGTEPGNTVSAYAMDDRSGKLTFLNKASSQGEMPTHLTIDARGRTLLVANYGNGTVASIPIRPDGYLSEAVTVDQHTGPPVAVDGGVPHAHAVLFSPDQRMAFSAELGLDRVYAYDFDAASHALAAHDPPFVQTSPGAGPRHMALHPNGRYLYVNNETNSTVSVYSLALKEIQTVTTLRSGFQGKNSTAEIQIDGSGRYLYVSNRGDDSIAIFAVNAANGTLTAIGHVSTQGKTPRNFSIDPTGHWLFAANENSSTVVLFRIDSVSGMPQPAGKLIEVPSPSCVLFVKAR